MYASGNRSNGGLKTNKVASEREWPTYLRKHAGRSDIGHPAINNAAQADAPVSIVISDQTDTPTGTPPVDQIPLFEKLTSVAAKKASELAGKATELAQSAKRVFKTKALELAARYASE